MSTKDPAVPAANDLSSRKKGAVAIICGVVAFASGFLLEYLLKNFTDIEPEIPVRLWRAVSSVAAFVFLGGRTWLRFDRKGFLICWLICLPIFAYDLYKVIPGLIWKFEDGIAPGVWGRIGFYAVLFVCVGVNEEFIFRGLILGGLLCWLGKRKHGAVTAAVISSLIFGYAHVMTAIEYSNIYSVLTGVLKTVQTGLFGFILAYCCIRHRQILAAAAIHSLNDFLLMLPGMMEKIDTSKEYVHADRESALASVSLYCQVIIICLIPSVILFIKLRRAEPSDAPLGKDASVRQAEDNT